MEKTERKLIIIIAAVTISLMVVILVGVKDSFRVSLNPGKELTLNREQQQLIENRDIIKIYVEKDLRYLDEEFLQDYLQSIAEPTRLKIRVVTDPGENIDGTLNVVTDRLREKADELQISAPLFQVKGGLFVSENIFRKKKLPKELDGAMAGDLLTEPQLDILSYNGSKIIVKKRNSAKATVALAAAEGMDCIVGNREAIMCELKAGGLQKKYLDTGAEFRTQNVCISSGKENAVFCELMSQCIQKADKRLLLLQAEERQGYRPIRLLDENRYGNMAILMAIISFAVFLTFFLYYQSNKNLYNELTERMNQLTASKKELKTTFNSVSYYMAELTPDGIISDINKAFLDFVDKECLGRHLLQVMDFYREDRKVLSSHLDAAREGKKIPKEEVVLGKSILEIEVYPLDDSSGKIEKLLFMAEDVTGIRTAERQMIQDNKMIAAGQLAAGVAHEIRNPLGIIRNYCYVLKTMDDPELKKQAIQVIERSVERSGKIIESLLNFSRVSDQRIESFSLKQHIEELLLMNEGKLKKKNIKMEILCREDLVVTLRKECFDMVLINLVSNGIDAIEGEGHITVKAEEGKDEFKLSVTDTGCGIDQEHIDEIFNPFFTTKQKTEGNGLGLYIVYNELTKMNGTIEVNSKIGEGTTFVLTLPLRLEENDGK